MEIYVKNLSNENKQMHYQNEEEEEANMSEYKRENRTRN